MENNFKGQSIFQGVNIDGEDYDHMVIGEVNRINSFIPLNQKDISIPLDKILLGGNIKSTKPKVKQLDSYVSKVENGITIKKYPVKYARGYNGQKKYNLKENFVKDI